MFAPGRTSWVSERARWNVSVVALAPKVTSLGLQPSRELVASRASVMRARVFSLLE